MEATQNKYVLLLNENTIDCATYIQTDVIGSLQANQPNLQSIFAMPITKEETAKYRMVFMPEIDFFLTYKNLDEIFEALKAKFTEADNLVLFLNIDANTAKNIAPKLEEFKAKLKVLKIRVICVIDIDNKQQLSQQFFDIFDIKFGFYDAENNVILKNLNIIPKDKSYNTVVFGEEEAKFYNTSTDEAEISEIINFPQNKEALSSLLEEKILSDDLTSILNDDAIYLRDQQNIYIPINTTVNPTPKTPTALNLGNHKSISVVQSENAEIKNKFVSNVLTSAKFVNKENIEVIVLDSMGELSPLKATYPNVFTGKDGVREQILNFDKLRKNREVFCKTFMKEDFSLVNQHFKHYVFIINNEQTFEDIKLLAKQDIEDEWLSNKDGLNFHIIFLADDINQFNYDEKHLDKRIITMINPQTNHTTLVCQDFSTLSVDAFILK
ncbi:MAG: hypothetical protein ATN36_06275 [Epulopiscium sp. Nele67-Bin005]|nr:MAG: hypothetical protein ATN36_06275 [Epulopiscium sp. Nele67-Bin005]